MYKFLLAAVAFLACAASIDAQSSTVYEIAKTTEGFSTLTAALELTDLDNVLDCTRFYCRYTVLAPTDTAFKNLPTELFDKLQTEDWRAHLTRILLYHVVPGVKNAADIEDGGKLYTLVGEAVNTTVSGGSVKINDATVTTADIDASNGVVHVVDQVLIPPFMTKDIIATAKEAGIFATLLAAVDAAALTETLEGPGPFTLFAPTDTAFDNLPEGTVEALLNDIPTLTDILTYHVVPDNIVLASELEDGTSLKTIQGEEIEVSVFGFWFFKFPYLNDGVYIIGSDILTSNGVIHVINEVLLPDGASPPEPTIAELVASDPNLSTLAAALEAANLLSLFGDAGDGPLTVFAPTDDAFAELGDAVIDGLLADPDALADILKYHVVAGAVKRKDLSDGAVETVNGADIFVDVGFFRVLINDDTRVQKFDIEASNGMVHVIDKVLLPPADCLTVAKARGLDSFVEAVDSVGLQSALNDPTSSLTIFAPNDSAFSAYDGVTFEDDILISILKYHVLPSVALVGDLSDDQTLVSLEGSSIEVTFKYLFFDFFFQGAYLNKSSKIVETDIMCAGGVIHVINEVLVPPSI